ncbi:MAG: hypothetical protein GEU88_12855 [Solirubrobacterales bacterium]|nr:hypothetical protein [Solirubrobacterales bacterium]
MERRLGEGEQSSGAVATALGYDDPRHASAARSGCIEKGLIYQAGHGKLAFTVPHFARYLTRAGASG